MNEMCKLVFETQVLFNQIALNDASEVDSKEFNELCRKVVEKQLESYIELNVRIENEQELNRLLSTASAIGDYVLLVVYLRLFEIVPGIESFFKKKKKDSLNIKVQNFKDERLWNFLLDRIEHALDVGKRYGDSYLMLVVDYISNSELLNQIDQQILHGQIRSFLNLLVFSDPDLPNPKAVS